MSGLRGRPGPVRDSVTQRLPSPPQLPLLDRLIDDAAEPGRNGSLSAAEALAMLRRSVRRDIEALLNARRRWRSWPPALTQLALSPLNYGIPDCTGGRFHATGEREALRREIEDTIRRFEPRFRSVRVTLITNEEIHEPTLRLRIDALLHAEPAPEPISFDTVMDPATADVVVRTRDSG
jgi:type VI secretion system protein ImpF